MSNWWDQPFRIIQTNLRETDGALDPERLVRQVQAMHANVLLFNVGGIMAFYPTGLGYQLKNTYMKDDILGEVLAAAHRENIRVIGRFDFSKAAPAAFEDHPDWFWKTTQGQPVIYNGVYHTCINGGWYREYALEILKEALSRYELDGVFFNMFRYQVRDYSLNYYGVCQCENCKRLFKAMYGARLPLQEDWSNPVFLKYAEFRRRTCEDVALQIMKTVKETRPAVGVMMRYDGSDLIRWEVNRSLDRALPEWGHWSGEQAKWAAAFGKGRPFCSTTTHFIDIPYRFVAESAACQALRLAQQLAEGAQLDYYLLGTLDQEDTKSYAVVEEIFQYQQANQELYSGLVSGAEVALFYADKNIEYADGFNMMTVPFRGMYRILAEAQIPFDLISDRRMNDSDIATCLRRYKVIILPNAVRLTEHECRVLDDYVRQGGRLIATYGSGLQWELGEFSTRFGLESLGVQELQEVRANMRSSYFRIAPAELNFPETRLMVLDQPYLYVSLKEGAQSLLRLIPPQRYGPPEFCYPDRESDRPGVIVYSFGKGQTAYLPWQPDSLYYKHGLEEYRELIVQLIGLNSSQPVLKVDAPPQLQVSVHYQPERHRTLVHLVNFSGHQGTTYHEPVVVHGARIKLRSSKSGRVWAAWSGASLTQENDQGYRSVTVPPVNWFETVVFEEDL